ncbi:T9SS type A sorting domain-containing protein [candidate division KSB1 bacterium]|nr:T9SS type A sorting domain-containing protein [candidate division KSB1 bacterium]
MAISPKQKNEDQRIKSCQRIKTKTLNIRWPLFIRWVNICTLNSVFFFCFFISLHNALGQEFTRLANGIPVEHNGEQLALPFLGGLDRFIPQFVDIDSDGDLDLFISDADGKLTLLENIGTSRVPQFRLVPDAFKDINVRNWFYFVDMESDGDPDLYHANEDKGLTFYRNNGSGGQADFVLEERTVLSFNGQPVFSQLTSIPAFADIDADRDYDFFSGIITGEIASYKNIGSRHATLFQFETERWQDLLIVSFGKASLSPHAPPFPGQNRHGASAIEFADLDGDGDLDFFYGDFFHKGMYYLRNDGDAREAKVAITDTLFPKPQPVITNGYNVPRFADIDGDGDLDFFVACLQQSLDNFIFYRNAGTADLPQLQPVTNNLLTMLDVGSNSAPALADVDADGDLDLFIGNIDGHISFYENIGSATSPALRWVTDALPYIQPNSHFSATPAFADIDADGDLDLFVGSFFGKIAFYENRGSSRTPDFVLITNDFANIAAGNAATPHFADVDRDGDYDLFVGSANAGVISLFENVGNARAPNLQLKKEIQPPVAIEYSVPFLYDWNLDGWLDLFIGGFEGTIFHLRGVAADSFAFEQKNFAGIDIGFFAFPTFADWDGDGHLDLLVGEGDGGLNFFRGTGSTGVADPIVLPGTFELHAYPNPFRDRLNISLRADGAMATQTPRAAIYNLLGARIAELEIKNAGNGLWRAEWQPASLHLSNGIYFLTINRGQEQVTRKLLLIH